MKNKNVLYGIKTVGSRIYIAVDEELKHYIPVIKFDQALLFKEEKHARKICNSLNNNKDLGPCQFETFKVLNPSIIKKDRPD